MRGLGRIAFKIWLCAVFGQIILVLAVVNSIEAMHRDQTAHQLRISVTRAAQPAAAAAALGFPLRHQAKLQTVVDDLHRTAPGQDIYIVDSDGTILFATDRKRVGTTAPPRWQVAPQGDAGVSIANTSDEILAFTHIGDLLATSAGMVVGRALRGNVVADASATLMFPVISSAVFLVLVGLLAVTGTLLATGPLSNHFAAMADAYHAAALHLRGRAEEPVARTPGVRAAFRLQAAFKKIEESAADLDHFTGLIDTEANR